MKKYIPKHVNELIILETIIRNKKITRTDISTKTNLTKSSISDITKTLIENKLIIQKKSRLSTINGGRKPLHLSFNGQCATSISIEVGINYIKSFFSYLDGQLIDKKDYINININKDNVIDIIKTIVDFYKNKNILTEYDIAGITIAIPGTVYENKILFTPYSDIDEISLYDEISKIIDFPIFLINESNASALGEYTFNYNFENLINLNIGDGIGAGIVKEGELYIGKYGKAGEVGHSTLFPKGIKCPCGNNGCLEQYASMSALIKKLKLVNDEDFDTKKIIKEWDNHCNLIINILKENAFYLSVGINNLISTYDPGVVIINNELYKQIPVLIEEIKKNLNGSSTKSVTIRSSTLDNNTVLLGCISYTAQQFLSINKLKF